MAAITVHSRLGGFDLLTRITRVSSEAMSATADLDRKPVFCGLEAMAQLAALHVRHCICFRSHAFLLKVAHGRWPTRDALQGCFLMTAERYSQSSHGFAYRVRARGPMETMMDADLLIGTRPYDAHFQEHLLEAHYREMFNRLRRDG
jgi:hypothetical protein